ncbi:unnamed protein product [Sphagnum compactum]
MSRQASVLSVLLNILILQQLVMPSEQQQQLEYACNFQVNEALQSLLFCDTSLSDDVRVRDLLDRMTLEEKITQLVNDAPAVPRLGIPSYSWWQEGLHGVAHVSFAADPALPHATSFPLPILTAASFNKTLWNQIGQACAVSTEARAFYNAGIGGLTYWSPVINIVRDPRWGRVQETSGEDPTLTSSYAIYFVKGMQEGGSIAATSSSDITTNVSALSGPRRLKVSACCKHFTAYDLDNWEGADRFHFDAQVTQQDLQDTYNPPFQSCVQEGQSSSLMCSYNRVNGVPTCADYSFLTETVRNNWGLNGYIVSDCDAVQVMHDDTGYAPTVEDAVADALNAGLDLNCGQYLAAFTQSAINKGKVNESRVDEALYQVLLVRMRLGMFDGNPANQQFGSLGPKDVCTDAHQELALEAARQSIVLLKNDGNILPLSQNKKIAVIGPNANASHVMLGDYEGIPCRYITPLDGLMNFGGDYQKVHYAPGCADTACEGGDLIPDAVAVALNADTVVLVVGLTQEQETESLDRTSLLLPGFQQDLISAVATYANGCPVVLVIMSAGPVDISVAKEDSRIQSIMWVGYPGEAGGQAIANIIFGYHNPGGRLPVSWYPEEYTKIKMTDMHMRPDRSSGYPGRTYRFYTGKTVYDFGYGLSYSTFTHVFTSAPAALIAPTLQEQHCYHQWRASSNSGLKCSEKDRGICQTSNFALTIIVQNVGGMDGKHSLLLFSETPTAGIKGAPLRQQLAFETLYLGAGEQRELTFNIDPCTQLSTVKEDGTYMLDTGTHILTVGSAKHSIAIISNFNSNWRIF